MSILTAAAVAVFCLALLALRLDHPQQGLLYLLAFPVWIVARDAGRIPGWIAAATALAVVVAMHSLQDTDLSVLGYVARAAAFAGAAAAGALAAPGTGAARGTQSQPMARLLTARPQIVRSPERLSRRELEVLEMISTGATNAQIAERFVISGNTVKTHVRQILKKLAVANRTEAAHRYIELYGTSGVRSRQAAADTARDAAGGMAVAGAAQARVLAVPRDDRVLLALEDERSVEAPVLGPLRERLGIGDGAIVYFDEQDRAVGWYLPGAGLGVDMRNWDARL